MKSLNPFKNLLLFLLFVLSHSVCLYGQTSSCPNASKTVFESNVNQPYSYLFDLSDQIDIALDNTGVFIDNSTANADMPALLSGLRNSANTSGNPINVWSPVETNYESSDFAIHTPYSHGSTLNRGSSISIAWDIMSYKKSSSAFERGASYYEVNIIHNGVVVFKQFIGKTKTTISNPLDITEVEDARKKYHAQGQMLSGAPEDCENKHLCIRSTTYQIPCNTLAAGVYIVTVTAIDGQDGVLNLGDVQFTTGITYFITDLPVLPPTPIVEFDCSQNDYLLKIPNTNDGRGIRAYSELTSTTPVSSSTNYYCSADDYYYVPLSNNGLISYIFLAYIIRDCDDPTANGIPPQPNAPNYLQDETFRIPMVVINPVLTPNIQLLPNLTVSDLSQNNNCSPASRVPLTIDFGLVQDLADQTYSPVLDILSNAPNSPISNFELTVGGLEIFDRSTNLPFSPIYNNLGLKEICYHDINPTVGGGCVDLDYKVELGLTFDYLNYLDGTEEKFFGNKAIPCVTTYAKQSVCKVIAQGPISLEVNCGDLSGLTYPSTLGSETYTDLEWVPVKAGNVVETDPKKFLYGFTPHAFNSQTNAYDIPKVFTYEDQSAAANGETFIYLTKYISSNGTRGVPGMVSVVILPEPNQVLGIQGENYGDLGDYTVFRGVEAEKGEAAYCLEPTTFHPLFGGPALGYEVSFDEYIEIAAEHLENVISLSGTGGSSILRLRDGSGSFISDPTQIMFGEWQPKQFVDIDQITNEPKVCYFGMENYNSIKFNAEIFINGEINFKPPSSLVQDVNPNGYDESFNTACLEKVFEVTVYKDETVEGQADGNCPDEFRINFSPTDPMYINQLPTCERIQYSQICEGDDLILGGLPLSADLALPGYTQYNWVFSSGYSGNSYSRLIGVEYEDVSDGPSGQLNSFVKLYGQDIINRNQGIETKIRNCYVVFKCEDCTGSEDGEAYSSSSITLDESEINRRSNVNNDLNSFILYPNPAENQIFVETPSQIIKYIISNSLGQTVLLSEELNTKTLTIDVSELKPGTYFINAFTKEGEIFRKSYVINK